MYQNYIKITPKSVIRKGNLINLTLEKKLITEITNDNIIFHIPNFFKITSTIDNISTHFPHTIHTNLLLECDGIDFGVIGNFQSDGSLDDIIDQTSNDISNQIINIMNQYIEEKSSVNTRIEVSQDIIE